MIENEGMRCDLLELPAELRVRIFEHVLVEELPITLKDWCRKGSHINLTDSYPVWPSEPSLLATCSQVRKEGLPIFYGQNVFEDHLRQMPILSITLRRFFIGLDAERRAMIKHVTSRFIGSNHLDAMEALCFMRARFEDHGIPLRRGVLCVRVKKWVSYDPYTHVWVYVREPVHEDIVLGTFSELFSDEG